MSLSLVETGSLARQAARGAGMTWGMSEEAGFAVRFLESFGLGGAESLVELLDRADGTGFDTLAPAKMHGTLAGTSGGLCPIHAGAAVCDFAHLLTDGQEFTLENVHQPLLLISFVFRAAAITRATVQVQYGDILASADGERLCFSGPMGLAGQANAIISAGSGSGFSANCKSPGARARISAETLTRLKYYAGRTYAPATEESRLLGAGAGVADND